MTSKEMMRKIGIGEVKTADEKNNGNLKNQIFKYLRAGKNKILLLEHQIAGGKNAQKFAEQVGRSKEKLRIAKQNFDKYEKRAEHFVEINPKKAVAMAVAAGMLAGTLWATFNKKKPAPPKKRRAPARPGKNRKGAKQAKQSSGR